MSEEEKLRARMVEQLEALAKAAHQGKVGFVAFAAHIDGAAYTDAVMLSSTVALELIGSLRWLEARVMGDLMKQTEEALAQEARIVEPPMSAGPLKTSLPS